MRDNFPEGFIGLRIGAQIEDTFFLPFFVPRVKWEAAPCPPTRARPTRDSRQCLRGLRAHLTRNERCCSRQHRHRLRHDGPVGGNGADRMPGDVGAPAPKARGILQGLQGPGWEVGRNVRVEAVGEEPANDRQPPPAHAVSRTSCFSDNG